jgi:8-oxo-dGTP diphosphatase
VIELKGKVANLPIILEKNEKIPKQKSFDRKIGANNVFSKMQDLGEDRIVGAGKNNKGEFTFAYHESGILIFENNFQPEGGVITKTSPLLKNLSESKLISYIKENVLREEESEITIIPSEYWFDKQKTTDVFLYADINGEKKFALIEREFPPYGYALAGGMVDKGEDSLPAALRELKEELSATRIEIVKDMGTIKAQEIRGGIETRFLIVKADNPSEVKAGDDANAMIWANKEELETMVFFGKIIPHHVALVETALAELEDMEQKPSIESVLDKNIEGGGNQIEFKR